VGLALLGVCGIHKGEKGKPPSDRLGRLGVVFVYEMRQDCETRKMNHIRMKSNEVMSRSLIALTLIFILWGPVSSSQLSRMDPLESFLKAMILEDHTAMQTIVRGHRKDLIITFFATLDETAAELKKCVGGNADTTKPKVAIVVAAKLAVTFNAAFPGENVLYSHLKDSRSLLTSRVRQSVASDADLAGFLSTCAGRIEFPYRLREVISDLESIINAATETPEARAERLLREYSERVQRDQAERAEQKRIAEFQTKVADLQARKEVQALRGLLSDKSLDVALRKIVIAALADLRAREAVVDLLKCLADDSLKVTVFQALGEIGGSEAEYAMVENLGNELAGETAAAALCKAWGEQAADRFISLLHDPSQGAARHRRAIQTLGALRCTEAVDELLNCMHDEKLAWVSVDALGQIGGLRAMQGLVTKLDDELVGERAKNALCRIGKPAIPLLLARLGDTARSAGMKRASQALLNLGYKPQTRTEKARILLAQENGTALMKLGLSTLPVAIRGLRTDAPGIRMTAIKVLGMDVGGAAFVLMLCIVILRRKWIWPKGKVTIAAGQYRQIPHLLPARGDALTTDPGVILWTDWARSRLRRRKRIKAEMFMGAGDLEDIRDGDDRLSSIAAARKLAPFPSAYVEDIDYDEFEVLTGYRRKRKTKLPSKKRCDVCISAGHSVRPGTYLAKLPGGSIRIRVTPPEPD